MGRCVQVYSQKERAGRAGCENGRELRKEVGATRSQRRGASPSAGRKEGAGSGEGDARNGGCPLVGCTASRTVAGLDHLYLDHLKRLLHLSNASWKENG